MPHTLITGATSGIGEALARELAAKGHSLILVARSKERLEKISKELNAKHGIDVVSIQQDLSQLNAADEVYKACKSLPVDFLINNAGSGLIGEFDNFEWKEIEEMLFLNIVTLTKMIYLFLPGLEKLKGKILNVSSVVAFSPMHKLAAYSGTKGYVQIFSEALRTELKERGVAIHTLNPGPVETNFYSEAHAKKSNIHFKFRTPVEVAKAALKGVEKNRFVTIPGVENRFMHFMNRFMPRSVPPLLSKTMVKKKG